MNSKKVKPLSLTYEEVNDMQCYQILAFNTRGKIYKSHIRTINLKYQLQHGIKNSNYLMDHIIWYQIFNIISGML